MPKTKKTSVLEHPESMAREDIERLVAIEMKVDVLVGKFEKLASTLENLVKMEHCLKLMQTELSCLQREFKETEYVETDDRSYFDQNMERYQKNKLDFSHKLLYIVGVLCTAVGWLAANLIH